jgi:lipoprotein-anchoring transpeptidase ErfK/SrfK
LVIKTDGAKHLRPGSFSVTQKENDPLWYAPKEYFMKRALPVPPEGSRERFKRAALGNQTLYLNDQTPIHSGPVWMNEIGGVRLNSSAMSELYSMVQVGARVEVR